MLDLMRAENYLRANDISEITIAINKNMIYIEKNLKDIEAWLDLNDHESTTSFIPLETTSEAGSEPSSKLQLHRVILQRTQCRTLSAQAKCQMKVQPHLVQVRWLHRLQSQPFVQ